ncbi:MAG: ABC transporter substrate-binding protein [Thermoanaerobaculia bacterium]
MAHNSLPTDRKKSLRVGLVTPIESIDPRNAGEIGTATVLAQIFEPPYYFPPTGSRPEPRLFAEPLREEPGARPQTHYSARVRSDVRFSNGTLLTAEIAARSLSRAPANQGRARFEAKGDRVHIHLDEPNGRYDFVLAQTDCGIALEAGGRLHGTGPFVLDDRCDPATIARSPKIGLRKNGEFRGASAISEIEFTVYAPEPDGTPVRLIQAIREGTVDFTTALTMEHVTRDQLPILPSLHPGDSTGILYFNTERPSIRGKLVRRAIASALSLEKIVAQAFERNPVAFVAMSLLPPSMGKHRALITASRSQAEELFKRPDVGKPSSLRLVVPWAPRPYLPKPAAVALEVSRQLAEVGIRVDLINTRDIREFFATLGQGEWDLALAGWVADNPDPADFLEALLSKRNIPTGGDFRPNISRYRSDAMEVALRGFRANPTDANRKAIFDLLLEDVPLLPLIQAPAVSAHSRRVRHTPIPATGVPLFADFEMAD